MEGGRVEGGRGGGGMDEVFWVGLRLDLRGLGEDLTFG